MCGAVPSNNLGLLNGGPFFFAEICVRRIAANIAGRSRCCCAASILSSFFLLLARQPFRKTEYLIIILRQLGRPIERLWWLWCSLAGTQWLYSSVQVEQQDIDCVSDFIRNPCE